MEDSKKKGKKNNKGKEKSKNPLNIKDSSKNVRTSLITKICRSVKGNINTKLAFFANQSISHILQMKTYVNGISKKAHDRIKKNAKNYEKHDALI